MRILEFEILSLPKLPNRNMYSHWRVKQSEAKKWKRLVAEAVQIQSWRKEPAAHAALTLIRCSSREPDFDGLVASFKHVIDGLKCAGVILDDRTSIIGQPKFEWIYARPKAGLIKVKMEVLDR